MAGLGNVPSGRCDVCHLDCLKLAPLTCLRHFCCSTCRKHCSKLQKNQFYCNICERREFESQTERRRESRAIDSFIDGASNQRKHSKFKDVQLTMTGSRLISLNDEPDDNDQNDLTGNNDEWELLISSLSYKPSCAEPIGEQKARSPPKTKSPDAHTKTRTQKTEMKSKENSLSQTMSQPARPDKYSDDSRIYNWCLAAEKSLSAASKSSARFEPLNTTTQAACFSSSSENHMGMKKFQRQNRKKDRPIWCDDSESDEEEWSECFSRRTTIDKAEKGEPKSNSSLCGNQSLRQTTGGNQDFINIPVGKSEESQFADDWYSVNTGTKIGQRVQATKVTKAPYSEEVGLVRSNKDFSGKGSESYSCEYEGLGQSSGRNKNVNIDNASNRDSNTYCYNDINSAFTGQNLKQPCHQDDKRLYQSRGIGNLTLGYNEQFQLGNKGFSFKEHERKLGKITTSASEMEKEKISNAKKNNYGASDEVTRGNTDFRPIVINKLKGQSLKEDLHAAQVIDLQLVQSMRGHKPADDSDGSSYDCGSIEGPLSDRQFPGFDDEDSGWLRANHTGTPVNLHDTFWDQ